MAKSGLLLLALVFAAWVGFAGAGGSPASKEPKDTLVRGKTLAFWLKELKDPDPIAREEALAVLAGVGEAARSAAPVLIELLKDKSAPVRLKAAIVLGQLKGHSKEAAPVLLDAYKNGAPALRYQILPALGPMALENEEVLLLLLRATGDADKQTQFLASLTINKNQPALFAPLAKVLDHADPVVRRQAVRHLGSAGKEAVPALGRLLKDKDWDTRFWAAHALWRIEKNPHTVLAVMLEANTKEDPTMKRAAREVVLQMRPPAKEALAIYQAILKDGTPPTKVQAADAVWHLTGKADDVLPIYRDVLETAPKAGIPAVTQTLAALKLMGPEAKSLRLPLLEILKASKDYYVIQSLPPILAGFGPESIPTLAEVAGRVGSQGDQLEQSRSRSAAYTLARMGKDGVQPLILLTEHKGLIVRIIAFDSLVRAGKDAKDAVPALRKILNRENSMDRSYVAQTFGRLGLDAKDALPDLIEVVRNDKAFSARYYALFALPHLRPATEDVLPLLEDALDDPDPMIRLIAADWLWHLDPKDARLVKIVASILDNPSCTVNGLKMLVHHRDAAKPAFPAVTELLANKNAAIRVLAIQTFDELGVRSKEHQQRLVAALADPEPNVKIAAALALRKLGAEEKAAIESLVKAMEKLPMHQQMPAVRALAEYGSAAKDAIPAIERQMPGTVTPQRVVWIEALAAIDPAMTIKWQFTLHETFTKYGTMPAARLLGQQNPKDRKYVDFLIQKLQEPATYSDRRNAAMYLGGGGAWAHPALPALRKALEDPHAGVRIQAALALEKLEPKKHKIVPVLIEALRDKEDHNVRLAAISALATLGPAAVDAIPALREAVRDPFSLVRSAANEALWKIDPTSAMPCVFQGY